MHAGYDAHYIRELRRIMVTPQFGIVELNGGHGSYWRTIEIVTPQGHYIEHNELYSTGERAFSAAWRLANV